VGSEDGASLKVSDRTGSMDGNLRLERSQVEELRRLGEVLYSDYDGTLTIFTSAGCNRAAPKNLNPEANRRLRAMLAENKRYYRRIMKPAEAAVTAAHDAEYASMIDLLETQPTTLAGVAAVARYASDHAEDWKDVWLEGDQRASFLQCLMQEIADAVDNIAAGDRRAV
jgi:hypothetical protein